MRSFDVGELRSKYGDDMLNFDAGLASQGWGVKASPAVLLSALKSGDSVMVDAPAGSPWEWMNGKALVVDRFIQGRVWCSCWEEDQGALVRKEFLCEPAHLKLAGR